MSVHENGNFLYEQFRNHPGLFISKVPKETDLSNRYGVNGCGSLIVTTGLVDEEIERVVIDFEPDAQGLRNGSEYWKYIIKTANWSQVSIHCQFDPNVPNKIAYYISGWRNDNTLDYFEIQEQGEHIDGNYRTFKGARSRDQRSWDSRIVNLKATADSLLLHSSTKDNDLHQKRADLKTFDSVHLMAQSLTSFCISKL